MGRMPEPRVQIAPYLWKPTYLSGEEHNVWAYRSPEHSVLWNAFDAQFRIMSTLLHESEKVILFR
jgi:hypothetical protein